MLDEEQLNGLYRYATALSQQRADAADLLQDSVEKYLIEVKCQRQVIDNPEAFVRTCIRNRCIDQQRHNRRWAADSYEEAAHYDISPVDPQSLCIDSDTLQRVWSCLSLQERDVLYHWAVLGYSTDEACTLLKMPRGSFLSCLHRLRKRIRAGTDRAGIREQGL